MAVLEEVILLMLLWLRVVARRLAQLPALGGLHATPSFTRGPHIARPLPSTGLGLQGKVSACFVVQSRITDVGLTANGLLL